MKQLKMMENMKYKAGDKVRIKSLDWYYQNRDRMEQVDCGNACFIRSMTTLCEKIVTISSVLPTLEVYRIKEDGGRYHWTDKMFEKLAEEGNNMNNIDKLKRISTPAEENWFEIAKEWEREDKEMDKLKHEAILPEGYVFKDENGNIINATKIVMEKKEKNYPKTYEECCKILGVDPNNFLTITNCYEGEVETTDYERVLLNNLASLWELRICRDAYWKLAGEEMGLGKPWKPDWENSEERRYSIVNIEGDINLLETTLTKWVLKVTNKILVFPTIKMRDAFYENFKDLIENCKELL